MKVQGLGFHPVPIGAEKKPPSWFSWTDYRDGKEPGLTNHEIETLFANPEVGRVGIILNKRSFLIDYDGDLGKQMLWSEVIPSCSIELQRLLRSTAHTKTPHGGHILVLLDPNAFPEGVEEILCWQLLVNGHEDGNAEIRVLSQNKYSIEYGMGYVPVIDIQEVVTLSKEDSVELVEICRRFKSESTAIRNIAKLLVTFWIKGRRQSLAFAISGYLHKNKVAIDLTRRLVQYLAQLTNDEEEGMRLDAVNRTYTKDVKEVIGYSMLTELIDSNESIIQIITQQLSKIGCPFRASDGNGEVRTRATENTGGDQDRDKEKELSAIVLELLEPNIGLLFKNRTDDRAFAAIRVKGHREIVPIHKSKRFDLWVRKTYYDETKDTLGSEVLMK